MNEFLNDLETYLTHIFKAPQDPGALNVGLLEAHGYPLNAGGKRVRPHLFALMAQCFNVHAVTFPKGEGHILLNAAAALELVHTYSLVHDDLPCLDNDSLRRGKPTTHVIYGDARALLVGDGLLTEAFHQLARMGSHGPILSFSHRCVLSCLTSKSLAKNSGIDGMVKGQWLDIESTPAHALPILKGGASQLPSHTPQSESALNAKRLESIHRCKTGCLLGAALEMGFYCGIALQNPAFLSHVECENIGKKAALAGEYLGLSFQIIDDILDATQSSTTLGKSAGKDAHQHKLTAVSLWGHEEAQKRSQTHTQSCHGLLHELFTEMLRYDVVTLTVQRKNLEHFMNALLRRQS